jgi:molecular chaperone GrpE
MIDEKQEEAEQAAPEDAPGAPADGEAPEDAEGLRALLDEEKERAQGYLANWQRAAADYQNFKRRVEEERSEVARLASASLVINLLPLLDDLERALRTVDSRLAGLTWIEGIWLIYRKFQTILENAGVQEIPAEGQQFDPQVHEAISQAPGDEGKIVSVVQKGYKLGERVIRPAMVVVGRKEQGTKEQGTGNQEQEGGEQGSDSEGD